MFGEKEDEKRWFFNPLLVMCVKLCEPWWLSTGNDSKSTFLFEYVKPPVSGPQSNILRASDVSCKNIVLPWMKWPMRADQIPNSLHTHTKISNPPDFYVYFSFQTPFASHPKAYFCIIMSFHYSLSLRVDTENGHQFIYFYFFLVHTNGRISWWLQFQWFSLFGRASSSDEVLRMSHHGDICSSSSRTHYFILK